MRPKVSIITPVYNERLFIKTLYEHICAQTIQDFEVIFSDDGSTDDTVEIIKEICGKDPRVKLTEQTHLGSGAARNKGIEKATGEYIAFLDADDGYCRDDALQKLYEAARKENAFIAGACRMIVSNNCVYRDALFSDLIEEDDDGPTQTQWLDFEEYQEDYHYQNYLFKRDFLISNDLWFPDYLRYQDPVFCLKAMTCAEKILVLPIDFYEYHVGYQNRDRMIEYIGDTLRGIRDNLRIAVESGYEQLYEKLIDRLNYDFYECIFYNFNTDVMSVLHEIDVINKESKQGIQINAIENIRCIAHDNISKYIFDETCRKMELLCAKDNLIEEYLMKNNMDTVVISGAGKMCEKLICLLKDSRITVKACLDENRRGSTGGNIPIFRPEELNLTGCKNVIISPVKYGNMARAMLENGAEKIIILRDLVERLYEENHVGDQ